MAQCTRCSVELGSDVWWCRHRDAGSGHQAKSNQSRGNRRRPDRPQVWLPIQYLATSSITRRATQWTYLTLK